MRPSFFTVVLVAAFLAIAGGGVATYFSLTAPSASVEEVADDFNEESDVLEAEPETPAVEIQMVAKQWTYEPLEIVVNEGDNVVILVESVDVPHSFTLPDFGTDEFGNPGINRFLAPNTTERIEFIADKKGEFVFGCDVVCGVGHADMLGKLIVQ